MRRSLLQGLGRPGSYDDEQRLTALLAATGAHETITQDKGQSMRAVGQILWLQQDPIAAQHFLWRLPSGCGGQFELNQCAHARTCAETMHD